MRREKNSSRPTSGPLLTRSRSNGPIPTEWERSREELVGEWCGEENRTSFLAANHPQTKMVSQLVDQFLDSMNSPDDQVLEKIQAHWNEVATNDTLVQKMHPKHFARGVLTIEVADATLMYVFREPRLQERLMEALRQIGGEDVQRLRMVMKGRGSV